MLNSVQVKRRSLQLAVISLGALVMPLAIFPGSTAEAVITGGTGNSPINNPLWPPGAAEIFNSEARVAYWEGPPFGGGEWHAECRGDARAFNSVLAGFARLGVKNRRIVIRDGLGRSFWLNPNRAKEKEKESRIDWTFTVWQPESWEQLRRLPVDLQGDLAADAESGPPSRLEVYTGGNIRWEDVRLPEGIVVDDYRLSAHGFTLDDGVVMEGSIINAATQGPLSGLVRVERIEPLKEGGYQHVNVLEVKSDADGRWVIKKTPTGWHRIIIASEGYVSRVIGYAIHDDQPGWQHYKSGLVEATVVEGQVVDDGGKPLENVDVRLGDVTTGKNGRYESDSEYRVKTDANGRFRFPSVPQGSASVWVHKSGYCRPGLGLKIKTPADDVLLEMKKSAQLLVTVNFEKTNRPAGYLVHIQPEEGEAVGRWSGSGNIDPKGQIAFQDVPPGRYVLYGRPNPGGDSEQTKSITVELKGGEEAKLEIVAR